MAASETKDRVLAYWKTLLVVVLLNIMCSILMDEFRKLPRSGYNNYLILHISDYQMSMFLE